MSSRAGRRSSKPSAASRSDRAPAAFRNVQQQGEM
jgi:hypothetical protein